MAKSGNVSPALKWSALGFSFIIGLCGAAILASSLRLLFDPNFSHLLFQNGIYVGGQILAGVGTLMLLAGILGCIAVLAESPCALSTFLAFLIVFIVAEITGGILVYSSLPAFQERVHFNIVWGVQRHYGNDLANTTILDLIQEGWKCCGSTGYSSWSNSVYGKRHIPRDLISTSNAFLVPKSCCVDPISDACEKTFVEGVRSTGQVMDGILHKEGCGEKLVIMTNRYSQYLFGLGCGIVLIQIIALILVSIFIWAIKSTGSNRFQSKAYYGGSAASQAMLDQQSDSHKSSPSFAGSRSPSLDLDQQHPQAQYPAVSSLV